MSYPRPSTTVFGKFFKFYEFTINHLFGSYKLARRLVVLFTLFVEMFSGGWDFQDINTVLDDSYKALGFSESYSSRIDLGCVKMNMKRYVCLRDCLTIHNV